MFGTKFLDTIGFLTTKYKIIHAKGFIGWSKRSRGLIGAGGGVEIDCIELNMKEETGAV